MRRFGSFGVWRGNENAAVAAILKTMRRIIAVWTEGTAAQKPQSPRF